MRNSTKIGKKCFGIWWWIGYTLGEHSTPARTRSAGVVVVRGKSIEENQGFTGEMIR